MNKLIRNFTALGATTLLATALTACGNDDDHHSSQVDPVKAALESYQAQEQLVNERLTKFDDLDFNVFTGEQWDRLQESHAENILVHWPDGHTTEGLDTHITDLRGFFVWAPDTRIETHPIRIGQGDYTGVVGVIEGTFTLPMPIGNDQYIQPTGQAFKLSMVTIGHWTSDGVMDEEWLFWDNQAFYQQIGLGQ